MCQLTPNQSLLIRIGGHNFTIASQNEKKPLGRMSAKWLIYLVNEAGFEQATLGFGGQYSIQLSYPSLIKIAVLSLPHNPLCI